MSRQSQSDLSEVVTATEAALRALAPALNRYSRVAGSDSHAVAGYLVAAKSCLQALLDEARRADRPQKATAMPQKTSRPAVDKRTAVVMFTAVTSPDCSVRRDEPEPP